LCHKLQDSLCSHWYKAAHKTSPVPSIKSLLKRKHKKDTDTIQRIRKLCNRNWWLLLVKKHLFRMSLFM